MLTTAYRAVRKFNVLARRTNPCRPTPPSPELQGELARRLTEEARELAEAQTLRAVVDALIDAIYIALDCCCVLGVDPSPIFRIVHCANLRKAEPDGWMRVDANGKVVKPEGWQPPDAAIDAELARQAALK